MEFPYTPVIGLARTVFFLQGLRFTILGEENVPAVGGAVMAINHTGYFDFTYAGLAARPRGRLVRFMAKKSVFGHRVTGPLMRGMKHIPVDRHAGQGAIEAGLAAVRAGEIVGIFPEATMSRSFELKPFKGGAARIARDGGVPLLPTTLWGSQRVWTKDAPKHRLRSNTPIHITVGQPLHLAADADLNEATEQLRLAMAGQLAAQQAAYPRMTGDDLRYLPARLGGTAPTPEQAHERDHHDMTRRVDKFNRGSSS
ncbi:MAG TPA: lysophospholipid acyltransferase family protein [Phycicoccus elongatus]|jgi:1-acyl-sn-glycerol-3-phosphate acyltransferase|uniref:lysophospholipid acyltransferase family protein n=1 Tax=Phycicoccus TaxID=367298 RepID=UPI00258C9F88|nr:MULTISPECIES: lysophospholipid acyltransferase family protein [Phycicoccus]MCA0321997.1 1-acyl-sn-glycerol-3-phosphate acyltransferase [Actinomycetota bacterium]MCO5302114.1 1-acyl-sn-glycerol-3-phosphate acyltransferase [Phycicoccus sp.]HOA65940.1 lysophospholipid acyltransferase family protein [Phycicoccus elongatus]HPF76462.1 lysophospholipid acyltransferase family protein [Phycicoccus elongatus]HPK12426.1 lysophospholipid acyltransferase family protein [Phycicoccus elongatus]